MTTIECRRVDQLSNDQWSLWLEIQQRSDVYESPYFCPEFTRAVAAVRSDVQIALLSSAGQTVGFFPFQRGKLCLGKPVGGKLSDYHGPLLLPGADLNPQTLMSACHLASFDFDHLVTRTPAFDSYIAVRDKSPQLDLAQGFQAYVQRRKDAGSDTIHRQGQKTRKMAREVGALTFTLNADDDQAFALLRSWKSAQLTRSGLADVFAFPWTLELIARLRAHRGPEFSAPLSVLRAGDKVAAVCLSLRSGGVLHAWFTAYNPDFQQYSPGLTLFVRLAEEAADQGIRKIDLGRGDERYKWSLASGSVEVGEGTVSSRSLATLVRASWRQTRDWMSRSRFAGQWSGKLLKPLREWVAYH